MKSKRFIVQLALAMLCAGAVTVAGAAELSLVPWPAQVQTHDGQFVLNAQTVIVAGPIFTNESALLAGDLHLNRTAAAPDNRILLTTQGADGLGQEAYELEVNDTGATIRATSAAGAFYGSQTLHQMLGPDEKTLPFATISDSPRYAWRGLMLDVSRHFFDEPTVLRVLDWMAAYKLNRLHLHLTDDQGWRLEIEKYPALTQIGARGNFSDTNAPPRFYTTSEIHEIVAYAAARHIVVVPEIDMPGHAGAAVRTLPELDGGSHTFNPARPETYAFIQNVLLDVMNNFPSPWIHFGGDEVNLNAWTPGYGQKTDDLQKAQTAENQFDDRIAQFIQQQGRTPAGWDEIAAAGPVTNSVIFWWRHDKPDVLVHSLAAGYPVVLAPRAPCYFDYPQNATFPVTGRKLYNTLETVYLGPQVPGNIPPAQLRQILGVEACIWSERIGTVPYLEFMTLPRLAAFGEMAWTPDPGRDFAKFETRLAPFLGQYRKDGIHFYDEANPQASYDDAKSVGQTAPLSGNSALGN